ncbi:MAG: hypothetical protein E6H44_14960 [Betaproteobacteria bacterium]|nr:MAG: hypothetical protein E6H44_14960 [Betaproteobacteria bacterium]
MVRGAVCPRPTSPPIHSRRPRANPQITGWAIRTREEPRRRHRGDRIPSRREGRGPGAHDQVLPDDRPLERLVVHSILEGEQLPGPRDIGVTDTAYLLGLGDVVGELRRFSLEHLRRGDIKLASSFLEKMERILDALMRFDYPTALVALKRKQDIARSLIEKTRGEVAVAARSQELADKLDAVRGKL